MNRRQVVVASGALTAAGIGGAALAFLGTGSMEDYSAATAAMRARLPADPSAADLVRYATLAANGHNTQSWRFRVSSGRIAILPDMSRRTPVVDPDDHHLFAGLGCAAENLALAAGACGRPGTIHFEETGEGAVLFDYAAGPVQASPLFDAIPHRQSTRTDYDGRPVPAPDLQALADAARTPGVDTILVTERDRIESITELILAANSAQMADAGFVRELKQWLRFNPRHALDSGDGLFSGANGNPSIPSWLGGMVFDFVFREASENDKYVRQMRSSSGLAVFVSERADREHWVNAGRACQRFALQATALGLKHAFMNQPVEVATFRPQLAGLLGLGDRRPDIIMRFGYGPEMPFSPRRPVEAVIDRA